MNKRILALVAGGLAMIGAAVAFGAAADHYQWQLPVGFYNAGVRLAGIDSAGNFNTAGSISADAGVTAKSLTLGSLTVTGLATTDGGLRVGNGGVLINAGGELITSGSLAVTAGDISAAAGNLGVVGYGAISGTLGADGGMTELGGLPILAGSQIIAGDNGWKFALVTIGTPVTWTAAFTGGTPHCFCNDLTATQFCKASSTTTTVTSVGTGTDATFVGCVGAVK